MTGKDLDNSEMVLLNGLVLKLLMTELFRRDPDLGARVIGSIARMRDTMTPEAGPFLDAAVSMIRSALGSENTGADGGGNLGGET